jgi:hypothetical protein
MFSALVRDGKAYRNDGRGWYETDRPPGIGLDPITASILPRFLARLRDINDVAPEGLQSELGLDYEDRAISANGDIADLPGLIAVDGQPFTELKGPFELTFDKAGRLTGIIATARNSNLPTFDLMVTTEIAIHYDNIPSSLPSPEPIMPAATPVEQ